MYLTRPDNKGSSFFLRGLGGPVFKNTSGQIITAIPCGQPYTFDVPGFSQVWLEQSRNGSPTFNGPYAVPMPSYIADCVRDVGTYQNNVYEIADGKKGAAIGGAVFQVTASAGSFGVPTQPGTNVPTEGTGVLTKPAVAWPAGTLTPTGVSTPSIVVVPGGGGYVPAEQPAATDTAPASGLSDWLPLAAGAGVLLYLFTRKGKRGG